MKDRYQSLDDVAADLAEVNTQLKRNVYKSSEDLLILRRRKNKLLKQYRELALKLNS